MTIISGLLADGLGNPIIDCQIELQAQKNSSTVLQKTIAYAKSDNTGKYNLNVKPGEYAVRICKDDCPPIYVGNIKINGDSNPGTLNDFLITIAENEITPPLVAQLTDERKQAQQAAITAQNSASQAVNTLANVVKKTGDTMTNTLTIEEYNAIRIKNVAKNISAILRFDGNDFWVLFSYPNIPDGSYSDLRPFKINSLTGEVDFGHNASIRGRKLVAQGDYGLGSKGATFTNENFDAVAVDGCGFYNLEASSTGTLPTKFSSLCSIINLPRNSNDGGKKGSQIIVDTVTSRAAFRTANASNFKPWVEFITTANSTTDSNGFLKKASPILRLFADENIEEMDGFTKSGCGLVNSEAHEVIAKRIDIGHYKIHGSLGFAKEGWYITLPEDANGNKKFFAQYSTDENNVITVKTFTKKFDFEKCEIVAGEPIDITEGRWIDIRLEMPVKEKI